MNEIKGKIIILDYFIFSDGMMNQNFIYLRWIEIPLINGIWFLSKSFFIPFLPS